MLLLLVLPLTVVMLLEQHGLVLGPCQVHLVLMLLLLPLPLGVR